MRKTRRIVLTALCGLVLAPAGAAMQIAPQPDVPAQPPSDSAQASGVNHPLTAVPPQARVVGWTFSSELVSAAIQRGTEVSLPAGQAELVVFFNASPAPGGATFEYRLDGLDADWTETNSHTAHYRRLPPGHYSFQVRARGPNQGWITPQATLSVEQKPFFYQTWYAYLIVGTVIVIVIAQLLAQRDQLLKGQLGVVMEERSRIAADCHDTLMAGFAAISWQLEATAKLFRDEGKATSAAAASCDLARSMVSHCQAEARRIIWDLRNSSTITNCLSEALAEAIGAHRLRDAATTMVEVHGNEIPIAPGAVHHLVCIGQEAVSNAIRHSRSSQIFVDLRYESDSLCLMVRDNGQGFHLHDQAVRAGHFGISVMEERTRKLGGQFRLTSSATSGTEVAVTVSFQKIHQPSIHQEPVVPWIGL